MCGICGIIEPPGATANADAVRRMADRVVHRGPDDEGVLIDGIFALTFRRLSIIALEGGHQPMANEVNSVWVVFNGEIYNFRELRSDLTAQGHVFRTGADSEVLVHGWEQWGVNLLQTTRRRNEPCVVPRGYGA